MNPLRRCRSGFTLTEILMATGILGIGLTMVASVFPVAVDQTRRSQEATMAALCARSAAAAIRAERGMIVPWMYRNTWYSDATGKPIGRTMVELTTNRYRNIPYSMRPYNPNLFLYSRFDPTALGGESTNMQVPRHDTTRTYVNLERGDSGNGTINRAYSATGTLWAAGGYVPVVFATPLDANQTGDVKYPYVASPFLLTIVVYKSLGKVPFNLDDYADSMKGATKYLKKWGQTDAGGMPYRGAAGMYVLNYPAPEVAKINAKTLASYHGEAYLVETVVPGTTSSPPEKSVTFAATGPASTIATTPPVTFAGSIYMAEQTSTLPSGAPRPGLPSLITLPGAIAVYHTVVGD